MIPAKFEYLRADSLESALGALTEHGDEAKLLAGGHSLIPLLKLRLSAPTVVVDIGELSDLAYIREEGDEIAIGATTRHHEVETSELVAAEAPLLREAVSHVGDPQVRRRGTLVGALCHGDPASDPPSALLALRGSIVAQGPSGRRTIAADDFFTGFLETALAPDEVAVEVRVPKVGSTPWAFQKFNRRAQDWAIVGVSALVGNGHTGIGLVHMGSTPIRAVATEAALQSGATNAEAAAVAAEGTNPPTDLNADPDYRRHLAQVLVGRALDTARG